MTGGHDAGEKACRPSDGVVVVLLFDEGDDVVAARSGGHDPGGEADVLHDLTGRPRRFSWRVTTLRGIQVEDQPIRSLEQGESGRPDVEGDGVLVGEVDEVLDAVAERMDRRSAFLRDLHPLDPLRE